MRVHEIFQRQSRDTPARLAVLDAREQLTYAELDARSDGVAALLADAGVGHGDRVGVAMSRSCWLIAALLGILKTGAAYVPLATGDPPYRVAQAARDAGLGVIACDQDQATALAGLPVRLAVLGRTTGAAGFIPPGGSASDLAYLMYTSGSTGRPKGVMIEHGSVVNLVRRPNFVTIGRDDVILQLAAFAFDVATFEIWGALLNGATLVMAPPGPVGVDEVHAVVRDHKVSVMWLTAALFHRQIDERVDTFRPVRVAIAGGDVLSVPHVEALRAAVPECQIVNGYGPTEATTFAACHVLAPDEVLTSSVPIGVPLQNVTGHVLDSCGLRVPDGSPGELYIGGLGVARGYWGAPAATAAAFVPDPFSAGPGRRLYRSGDRVRRRPDGALEFLGRMDDQFKLRGMRIEPGEVESVLAAFPAVRQAAVVIRRDELTGDRLVAYVVPSQGTVIDRRALRRHALDRLAAHLVPAEIVTLGALPVNGNGKVDRTALTAM